MRTEIELRCMQISFAGDPDMIDRLSKRLACALARRFTLSQNGYGTKLGWMVSISRL